MHPLSLLAAATTATTSSPPSNVRVEGVTPDYTGARIEGTGITLEFVKKMMEDLKNKKPLHQQYVYQILTQTRELLSALPTLVDITVPVGKHITVCGDIHGQFYDLLNIFELNGLPSEDNPYLFNGDFVDRGAYSLEVILTLFAFKCLYPSAMHLIRGNHETRTMNRCYGFYLEVETKLNDTFVDVFADVFCCLPLAYVINAKVFVVHGGLFEKDGVTLEDIRAIDRFREPPGKVSKDDRLMSDMLWSDPHPGLGRAKNLDRGSIFRSVIKFGSDVTETFLEDNNLDLIVRSHEDKEEGYEIEHGGRLITVFSAPNYCRRSNRGAFIRFEAPQMMPNIVTFDAVPQPQLTSSSGVSSPARS